MPTARPHPEENAVTDTQPMPVRPTRHRRRGWWRRNWDWVVALAFLGPAAVALGAVVAADEATHNPGFVPYAAVPGIPVVMGPARPTMTVEATTARPVTAVRPRTAWPRYVPTPTPSVVVFVVRLMPRAAAPAAPPSSSRAPAAPTTTAPPPSLAPSSTAAPTIMPSTTAATSPPATTQPPPT